jgi:hypothetical protein
MKTKTKNWIPEICYEEDSQIPFIEVPTGEKDPSLLFIFLNRNTGETEMGSNGKELPIFDMDLRQFVDMKALKLGLTEVEYDRVRSVLGLNPLREAARKGQEITSKVKSKVEEKQLEAVKQS